MLTNAFIGRPTPPTDTDLTAVLGPAKPAWDQLLAELATEHGVEGHEWKSYSAKGGWALRASRKKRTIVWLSPASGGFNVTFILGAKAMEAARPVRLPKPMQDALSAAPKYPEGFGVRLVVKSSRHIGALKKLAAIKLAH